MTTPSDQGIDTIGLIVRYTGATQLINSLGLELFTPKRERYNETYRKIEYEIKKDTTTRYKSDQFQPIIEVVKLPSRGNNKNLLMAIIRNTPLLFDLATQHKRPKGTYCIVLITGLHQPTYHINYKAMKIISTFLKRKTFKLYRLDIAIDTHDKATIDYKFKEVFKKRLKPFSKCGVFKPPNGATMLYIDEVEHERVGKITYYDKTNKQEGRKKQKNIPKGWKRLEVILTFEVTSKKSYNFFQYVESMLFRDDLETIDTIARKAHIKSYKTDFLNYQLNSFVDNRFLNNKESKEQSNSPEALERFKASKSIFKRAFN